MIKNEDIKVILEKAKDTFPGVTEKDIVFAALCSCFTNKKMAYKYAYGLKDAKPAVERYASEQFQSLLTVMAIYKPKQAQTVEEKPIKSADSELTREQNKQELIKLIARTERAIKEGTIEEKDGLKMIGDWRTKLNDKFEMEQAEDNRRIIVVPAKHDIICPHTNKECYQWPSKEACMAKYKLKEA